MGILQVSDTVINVCAYTSSFVFLASSWVIMVWDGLVTLDDEVQYVWRYVVVSLQTKPCGTRLVLFTSMPRTAHIKWLYFLVKYLGLALQT